jgi:LytR cell envelope-related transcriptional attenuator
MHLIENLGAYLGLIAFVGFAVLVLLYFQQARDVRRLRDWAGRAPERAAAAAEAAETAAAEAAEDAEEAEAAPPAAAQEPAPPQAQATPSAQAPGAAPVPESDEGSSSTGSRLSGLAPSGLGERFRRIPLPEPRYLIAGGVVIVLAVAVIATGAFGLIGGGSGKGGKKGGGGGGGKPNVTVAVLNGTGGGGAAGVPGLASKGAAVVRKAGYKVGAVADADESFTTSELMFVPSSQADAKVVQSDLAKPLGTKPELQQMSPEVKAKVQGAKVALVVGLNNSHL